MSIVNNNFFLAHRVHICHYMSISSHSRVSKKLIWSADLSRDSLSLIACTNIVP